jgi:hypothetical protein
MDTNLDTQETNGLAAATATATVPAPEHAPERAPADTSGNVDKIRDILFGSHMRSYEGRFARLEETLIKETSDLRDSAKKRFDALEAFVRNEFDALQARLKSERDERSEAHRQISRDLKDTGDALAKRITEVHDYTDQAQRQLRGDILQQGKELTESILARQQEVTALLEKRFQELRKDKTDRAALSALLSEVALRLKDEFSLPGAAR